MAIIDVVKWDAAPGVYAWKYPSSELSTWTQLIVSESQEALMLKEGQAVGPFTAGRHVLSSDNFPILNSLLKIPFGKSPYTAEVWFVQKSFKLNIKWGTTSPIQLEDPRYHVMLPVRAFGQYGITVEDTSRFLIKLVGTLPAFTEKTLTEYFKGIIVTRVKDLIAKYLVEKKISIFHISANLNEISSVIQEQVADEIREYGLKVVNFNINSISTDDSDPVVKKLKDALATRAEMEIVGFNYQQMRSFDTLETAAGNSGSGGGVMNAGIGMGMGMGMGVPMGNVVGNMSQSLQTQSSKNCPHCQRAIARDVAFCPYCGKSTTPSQSSEMIECDKCHAMSPKGAKFCPNCGDIFNCCPVCGTDNPKDAKQCIKCGNPMPINCPNCKKSIAGDLKFCPECGIKLVRTCTNCHIELANGLKFCPECGQKIEGE